jgi:hypothetical protein
LPTSPFDTICTVWVPDLCPTLNSTENSLTQRTLAKKFLERFYCLFVCFIFSRSVLIIDHGVRKPVLSIPSERLHQLQRWIISAREILRPPPQVRSCGEVERALAIQLKVAATEVGNTINGHCNGGRKCNRSFPCLRPESHEIGRSGRHVD